MCFPTYKSHGTTVLREMNIPSLFDRRSNLLRSFAAKAARSSRFALRWFPENPDSGPKTPESGTDTKNSTAEPTAFTEARPPV